MIWHQLGYVSRELWVAALWWNSMYTLCIGQYSGLRDFNAKSATSGSDSNYNITKYTRLPQFNFLKCHAMKLFLTNLSLTAIVQLAEWCLKQENCLVWGPVRSRGSTLRSPRVLHILRSMWEPTLAYSKFLNKPQDLGCIFMAANSENWSSGVLFSYKYISWNMDGC